MFGVNYLDEDAFGDIDARQTDTLGGVYPGPYTSSKAKYDNVLPRYLVTYKPFDGTTLYANYSEGARRDRGPAAGHGGGSPRSIPCVRRLKKRSPREGASRHPKTELDYFFGGFGFWVLEYTSRLERFGLFQYSRGGASSMCG